MILLIDNYDSFTYNLVQTLGEVDSRLKIEVHRVKDSKLCQAETAFLDFDPVQQFAAFDPHAP